MDKIFGYIYLIFNLNNDKIYVGKTVRPIAERFRRHKSGARNGTLTSLGFALRKYGPNGFGIIQLCYCRSSFELSMMERFYIIKFKSHNKRFGYNMTDGGDDGYKANPEFVAKNRKSQIGKKLTQEHKDKIKANWVKPSVNPQAVLDTIKRNQERDWNIKARKKISEISRIKRSEPPKEQGEKHSKRMSGRKWINDGKNEKFVVKEEFEKYFKLGWGFGRIRENAWKNKKQKKSLRLWQMLQEPENYTNEKGEFAKLNNRFA